MNIVGLKDIKASYVQHVGSDLMVVRAAKVSTGKEAVAMDEKAQGLIRYLAKNHHDTPFEMCDVTFLIECPIFIARQFHRHRSMSYNEWSGRYSIVGENFYIPDVLKKQGIENKQGSEGEFTEVENKDMIELMKYQVYKAVETYDKLLDKGVSKELARMILPQNMMTKFYAKANLRNLMHYCSLRCDKHAQFEHQYLAKQMFNELLKMFPISVGALAKAMFSDELLETMGLVQKAEVS